MTAMYRFRVPWRLAAVMSSLLLLGIVFMRPLPASAHWSMCLDDPKVWLDNGVKVDMQTSVFADPSLVTHLTFTLHVPPGVNPIRTVFTQNSTIETVNVAQDSSGGYSADVVATVSDGLTYPVVLVLHIVDQSSVWALRSGLTG